MTNNAIPCPVPFPDCGPDGCHMCGGAGEYTPAHLERPTRGQLALNGARLALAQFALDAETLLNTWEEREKLLEGLPPASIVLVAKRSSKLREMVQSVASAAAKQEIARCRQELQGLLKLWGSK
jgi:hypothetical protein